MKKHSKKRNTNNKRKTFKKSSSTRKRKTFKKSSSTRKRKTFKKIKFIKGGDDTDICAVCLENLTNPTDNVILSCGHTFHKNCMVSTCEASLEKTDKCLCPLCRKELITKDMNELGFSPNTNPQPVLFEPGLDTVEKFKDYVNIKLRTPTSSPLLLLREVLNSFIGTDDFPSDLIGNIMVFDLLHISGLNSYKFIGLVENVPSYRGNKKYFEFKFNDDEYDNIPINVVEL